MVSPKPLLLLFFKEMPWATFVWFGLEDFTVVVTQLGTSFNQSIIFFCVIITSARLTFMSYFELFSVTVTRLEGFFRVSYKDVAYQTPNAWGISRFYQSRDAYRHYHWFPSEMPFEERKQEFHTDDVWVLLLISWEHYPDLTSNTSSVWNFCFCYSNVISLRNQW